MSGILEVIGTLSDKKNTWWIMSFFLISVLLIENGLFGQLYFRELTGKGMIDMNFFNTAPDITNYLSSLGQRGREVYQRLLFLDFVLIAAFFLLQGTFVAKLLKNLNKSNWLLHCLMPVLIRLLADLAENILMLSNTLIFPDQNGIILSVVGICTLIKWLAMYLVRGILITLIVMNAVKWLKYRRTLTQN